MKSKMSDRGFTPSGSIPMRKDMSYERSNSDHSTRKRRRRSRNHDSKESRDSRRRTRERRNRRLRRDSYSSRDSYPATSVKRSRSTSRSWCSRDDSQSPTIRRSRIRSRRNLSKSLSPKVIRSRSPSRKRPTERRSRIDTPSPKRSRSRVIDQPCQERSNITTIKDGHNATRSPCSSPRTAQNESRCASSLNSSKTVHSSNSKDKCTDVTSDSIIEKLINLLQNGGVRSNAPHIPGSQNIITEFDPNSKSQTMKNWITKVNESAEIYGWSEHQTIYYALPKLKGLAKKWYDGLTTVKFSWAEWQQNLLEAFPDDQNYADQLVEMLNRKSRRNETLVEYFYDKIMLINRCKLKGRQAVDCISHGIYEYNIRMHVEGAHYDDPNQVLEYFRNITHKKNDTTAFKKTNSDRYQDSSRKFENKSSNDNTSNQKTRSVSCYNCGELGHTVYKCSKEILKCNKCKRHGHLENNCKAQKLSNTNENSTMSKKVFLIASTYNSDSKYYKQVRVNDVEMTGYIDFGSECTLITEEKCKELNLNLSTNDLPKLRGFGHSSITPCAKTQIRVKADFVDVQAA
ncbi:uncharacterized protein LOC133530430 [Cydia pomonella]|uniref:uncharacterized protein LOC133530430 n=1 Tax=Cydia pomonella TaxID=82600 RepID=UPI002ADE0A5E|nr:uncharacterized protein LOC133530430 [Cydia pomonella]